METICLLQYADDTVLFLDGSGKSFKSLLINSSNSQSIKDKSLTLIKLKLS